MPSVLGNIPTNVGAAPRPARAKQARAVGGAESKSSEKRAAVAALAPARAPARGENAPRPASGGVEATPDSTEMCSEAQALEQQMIYMQMRLAKIRSRSAAETQTSLSDSRRDGDGSPTVNPKASSTPIDKAEAESDKSAASVSSSTPNSRRTTTELRAASARSFVHLPPLNSKFKVLVVGNAKCGKTSVIQRFASGSFSDNYKTTIGADFTKKLLDWGGIGEDQNVASQVKLQMWDIAGQDRFARLTRAYFNAAKGALVVCDVTRSGTFTAAAEWKRELDRVLTTHETGEDGVRRPVKIPCILIANKADLLSDVASSFVAGAKMEQMCRQHGFAGWFVTSAKSGDNVDAAMRFLTRQMLAQRDLQRAKAEGGGSLSSRGMTRGSVEQHKQGSRCETAKREGNAHNYGGFVTYENAQSKAKLPSAVPSQSDASRSSSRVRAYYQADAGPKNAHNPHLMYDTLPRKSTNDAQLRIRGGRRHKLSGQHLTSKSSGGCC